LSPDEKGITYGITSNDTVKDKTKNHIGMVSAQGGEPIPMTSDDFSASNPKGSRDRKYLLFMAKKKKTPDMNP